MNLYEADIEEDAPHRYEPESVDAWMRAAAYAAGDDPGLVLGIKAAQTELVSTG